MGLLDRWVSRFSSDDDDEEKSAEPNRAFQASDTPGGPPQRRRDPLDDLILEARSHLTLDDSGKRYAEGYDFQNVIASLDEGARSKAGDALLADALLVHPAPKLRRRLVERLLHRGDRDAAKGLLEQLAEAPEHAPYALTQLAEILEQNGDKEGALAAYERVLALDINQAQAKARARRLRAGRERRGYGDNARDLLTRFLGAKAAGSRYAVREEIGRGGAATVFRARDRVVEREVALKIFHPRGKADARRARILHEARIAAVFDHPHIVPILDVDDERDLLVMSLCEGGSLRGRLANGRLGVLETAEYGAAMLRTLADVHEAGSAHLDIKPSNLLFHEGRLMLCDFGTAGLVQLGAAAGTRAYMAPEQRAGGRVGPASDCFAAGLVVFECLTGHLPQAQSLSFDQSTPTIVLDGLNPGPRRRALEDLLSAMVVPEPTERPEDLRAVASHLLRAAALPASDKDGTQLFEHLSALAEREGDAAVTRLSAHPLTRALVE